MKKISMFLLLAVCTSISSAAFDHTVTDYYNGLYSINNESLLVDGDGVRDILAEGSSYVEVKNTLPLQTGIGGINSVSLKNDSSMKIIDGQIGNLDMYNNSKVELYGGEIISNIDVYSGEFIMNDGYVKRLDVWSAPTVTLMGGDIDYLSAAFNVYPGIHITFVCDLETLGYSIMDNKVVGVSGNWVNGTSFDIKLNSAAGGATFDHIQFVPEPASLALLGLGGLLLRKRKYINQPSFS